jgi:hypothetical protein
LKALQGRRQTSALKRHTNHPVPLMQTNQATLTCPPSTQDRRRLPRLTARPVHLTANRVVQLQRRVGFVPLRNIGWPRNAPISRRRHNPRTLGRLLCSTIPLQHLAQVLPRRVLDLLSLPHPQRMQAPGANQAYLGGTMDISGSRARTTIQMQQCEISLHIRRREPQPPEPTTQMLPPLGLPMPCRTLAQKQRQILPLAF